jgi:hypothetical protein
LLVPPGLLHRATHDPARPLWTVTAHFLFVDGDDTPLTVATQDLPPIHPRLLERHFHRARCPRAAMRLLSRLLYPPLPPLHWRGPASLPGPAPDGARRAPAARKRPHRCTDRPPTRLPQRVLLRSPVQGSDGTAAGHLSAGRPRRTGSIGEPRQLTTQRHGINAALTASDDLRRMPLQEAVSPLYRAV